jgi:hypothetical protein
VQSIRGRVKTLIKSAPGSEPEAVAAALEFYHALKKFHAQMPEKNTKAFTQLVLSVILAVDEALLERLAFENLTPALLTALPNAFIKRGMERKDATPFIMMQILRAAAQALDTEEAEKKYEYEKNNVEIIENSKYDNRNAGSSQLNLKYWVHSYTLDAVSRELLTGKLREFFQNHIRPAQYENIAFLFRSTETADAEALLAYVDAYGGAEKAAFAVWAFETRLLTPQNAAHADAARRLIKNNIKDPTFKETIYTSADLKALSKEGRFARLTGKW